MNGDSGMRLGMEERMKKKHSRTEWTAYLFLVPAAVIYLSVIVAPVCYSFVISLFKWNGIGAKEFIGLNNYITLFKEDKIFHRAILNNMTWIILTIFVTMLVSLGLAVLLSKSFRGRTLVRTTATMEITISTTRPGMESPNPTP